MNFDQARALLMRWGKHKGLSLGKIQTTNPGYMEYLFKLHAEGGLKDPRLEEPLKVYRENWAQICDGNFTEAMRLEEKKALLAKELLVAMLGKGSSLMDKLLIEGSHRTCVEFCFLIAEQYEDERNRRMECLREAEPVNENGDIPI